MLSGHFLIGQASYQYPEISVLSTGNWYKFGVGETGIYKLTYADFKKAGVNVSNLSSKNISIFGNGGGMLPEDNRIDRYNDLVENAIYVEDGGDGKFDENDYILFYAQSPNAWSLNTSNKLFYCNIHLYSAQTYYFLTVDEGIGSQKRIEQAPIVENATDTITTFNGYKIHKKELINIPKAGRTWLGEKFDNNTMSSYSFPFGFPNLVQGSDLYVSYVLTTQSTSARYVLKMNDQQFDEFNIGMAASADHTNYFATHSDLKKLSAGSPSFNINISYSDATGVGNGYLNSITINALQNLAISEGQMNFRSIQSVGEGKRSLFKISNADSRVVVWNVSDPVAPARMRATLNGNELSFIAETGSLKEFIAFNGSSFRSPTFIQKATNQNLHGLPQVDYVIVTHPAFKSQAERLATLHRAHNGLDVAVATTTEVYNEFSSGAQDPIGIRCFLKMFYDRAEEGKGKAPKYLLLFGSGSYDNKNIEKGKRSFVVVYETESPINGFSDNSLATDDIFGYLSAETNKINVGIGRFPATTEEEANVLVGKSENYMLRKDISKQKLKGNWRNVVCLISDDPDEGSSDNPPSFLNAAERLATELKSFKNICVEKIYADAYKQTSSSLGLFYPEATKAINNRIKKGCLIVNYIGHGSEQYLGHERYIVESDINSWDNQYALPIFIANTCSFSRYDLTDLSSAGERIVLTGKGGFIASIAPTRTVSVNHDLNNSFFINALTLNEGTPAAFGDIVRLTKNSLSGSGRPYVLIGDPALKISLPKNSIRTTKINDKEVSSETSDTLKALSRVTIEGEIMDEGGNLLSDFNGEIYPTVYDKPEKIQTVGNEGIGTITTFLQQKNILYKGRAKVKDGKFSLSFIIPRDMSYRYDYGKISYYAQADNAVDAAGNYMEAVFGGIDETVDPNIGVYPKIRLYLNDTNFRSGGITDEKPVLLAILSDDFGINTVGSGIGHDITAVIDDKVNEEIILNDFYDIDSFGRVVIRYPLDKLKPGTHTLTLKAWNIFNYSNTATLDFIVQDSKQLELGKLINAPNPFRGSTYFSIEHNLPDGIKSAEIQIFNMSGQLVKIINVPVNQGSYMLGPVEWNPGAGQRMSAGIYFSRIIVTTHSGEVKSESQKLVILP